MIGSWENTGLCLRNRKCGKESAAARWWVEALQWCSVSLHCYHVDYTHLRPCYIKSVNVKLIQTPHFVWFEIDAVLPGFSGYWADKKKLFVSVSLSSKHQGHSSSTSDNNNALTKPWPFGWTTTVFSALITHFLCNLTAIWSVSCFVNLCFFALTSGVSKLSSQG